MDLFWKQSMRFGTTAQRLVGFRSFLGPSLPGQVVYQPEAAEQKGACTAGEPVRGSAGGEASRPPVPSRRSVKVRLLAARLLAALGRVACRIALAVASKRRLGWGSPSLRAIRMARSTARQHRRSST